MRFVHLTDPHLSTLDAHRFWRLRGKRRLGYLSWTRRRVHHHRAEVLDALTEQALKLAPQAFAVTGDLVQLGLTDEHAQAREWLQRLQREAPVMLVPGNHDVYQADAVPSMFASWGAFLGTGEQAADAFPIKRDIAGVRFIGLSSATPEPFWSAGGEIGNNQLERLERLLAASRDRLTCVLVHHPPLDNICPRRKALRDADELARTLTRHRVPVILHGHIHRNRDYALGADGRVFSTASASNADARGRASLRLFDVDDDDGGWRLRSRLFSLSSDLERLEQREETAWKIHLPGAQARG